MLNFNLNSLIRTQQLGHGLETCVVSKAIKIRGNNFRFHRVYEDIIRTTSGRTVNTPI